MNPVHFSSATDQWATPQDFFDRLNAEFNFVLDVCADETNAKCPTYYTKADDGLAQDWSKAGGPVWMNPPYGRGIGQWVIKAAAEAKKGATVVCLLPSRTDPKWWWQSIQATSTTLRPGVEVRYIPGRLKFGGAKTSAPFPSVVVVFNPP